MLIAEGLLDLREGLSIKRLRFGVAAQTETREAKLTCCHGQHAIVWNTIFLTYRERAPIGSFRFRIVALTALYVGDGLQHARDFYGIRSQLTQSHVERPFC